MENRDGTRLSLPNHIFYFLPLREAVWEGLKLLHPLRNSYRELAVKESGRGGIRNKAKRHI
jgi:hypothetical protein